MLYARVETNFRPDNASSYSVSKSHHKLLQHFTAHLSPKDFDYFLKWERLIDLEAHASEYNITKSWLVSPAEKEAETGKCASGMTYDTQSMLAAKLQSQTETTGSATLRWFRASDIIFSNRSQCTQPTTPLSKLNIEPGSMVVVSADTTSQKGIVRNGRRIGGGMFVARGIVKLVSDDVIEVTLSLQDISQVEELAKRQEHAMKRADENVPPTDGPPPLFRIDRDEVITGLGTLRQNLINLLTGDTESLNKNPDALAIKTRIKHHRWLREMVIHLRPPEFDYSRSCDLFQSAGSFSIPGCNLRQLEKTFLSLNKDQQQAVKKVR